MSDLRIVMDTGVVICAVLLSRSLPRQAFDAASEEGQLLVSEETLTELDEVLRREKFNKYVSEAQRLEFLAAIIREAELVNVADTLAECRDPRDDKFLELAISGNAKYIVSGDSDLLVLHPFRGVEILTPKDFVDTITKN